MNQITAKKIALSWIDAWNKRDIDKLSSLFHEDCELLSPVIPQILGSRSSEQLRGIRNIKRLWSSVFELFPAMKMELISVMSGVDSMVVNFRGAYDTNSANVFYFNKDNKIIKSVAYFEIVLSENK